MKNYLRSINTDFTYHAAVGRTGSENIKFYSRECGSCPLSDNYFEVTLGRNGA